MDLLKASYGHALVLFTSYAAMSAVKDRLQKEILRAPLFTLGRNAVHILEEFRATPGSVLLATGAAWEGIDFPRTVFRCSSSRACRLRIRML